MNKKLLLTTTMAGTMFVAGMANPIFATTNVKFDNAGWMKDEEGNAVSTVAVELSKENAKKMTIADLKAEVTKKYGEEVTITKIVGAKGEEIATNASEDTTVGTGAKVTLSNGKEMTVVVFGDVTGDGVIDVEDIDTIFYDKATLEGVAKKAGDLTDDDTIDVADIDRLFYYTTGDAEGSYVDKAKLPEEAEATIEFGVVDESSTYDPNTSAIQEINVEDTTITIKAILGNASASTTYKQGYLRFKLNDKTKDCTFDSQSGDNIIVEKEEATGNEIVYVKNVEGSYSLKIKNADTEMNLTIIVQDTTIPAATSISVEDLKEDDVSGITDSIIKTNTEALKQTVNGKTMYVNPSNTFQGNSNLMEKVTLDGVEGKYYRARIRVVGYNNANLQAVNQDTGRVYKTEAIPGTTEYVYVYLDADESLVNLVMKNSGSTDKQVEKATPVAIHFKSTGKLSLISVDTYASEAKYSNQQANQALVTGKVALNEKDKRIVDAKLKLGEMSEYVLNILPDATSAWTEKTGTAEAKYKWIGIPLKVTSDNSAAGVYTEDTNIYLNHNAANSIIVWFHATEEPVKFTLQYKVADKVEKLDVTINIKDVTQPVISTVVPGDDDNAKGVNNIDLNNANTKQPAITLDAYKYAMTEIEKNGTKSRWYGLKLKTNVSADKLVYQDKDGNWVPCEVSGDGAIIYVQYEDTVTYNTEANLGKTITILNKNMLEEDGTLAVENNSEKVEITVKAKEESKLLMSKNDATNALGYTAVKDTITNVENLPANSENALNNNIKIMNGTASKMEITYKSTLDAYELKLNTTSLNDVTFKGTTGKWIIITMAITDATHLKDANPDNSVIYVDYNSASKILGADLTNAVNCPRVPVWINLSKVKTYKPSEVPTAPETTEIKYQSKDDQNTIPTEERTIKIYAVNKYVSPLSKFPTTGGSIKKEAIQAANTDEKKVALVNNLTGAKLKKEQTNDLNDAKQYLEQLKYINVTSVVADEENATIKVDINVEASKIQNLTTLDSSKTDRLRVPFTINSSILHAGYEVFGLRPVGDQDGQWGSFTSQIAQEGMDVNDEILNSCWSKNTDWAILTGPSKTVSRTMYIFNQSDASSIKASATTEDAVLKSGKDFIKLVVTLHNVE